MYLVSKFYHIESVRAFDKIEKAIEWVRNEQDYLGEKLKVIFDEEIQEIEVYDGENIHTSYDVIKTILNDTTPD